MSSASAAGAASRTQHTIAQGALAPDKSIKQIHKAVLQNDAGHDLVSYTRTALEFIVLPLSQETEWLRKATDMVKDRFGIEFGSCLNTKNFVEKNAHHKFNDVFGQRMRRNMLSKFRAVFYQRRPPEKRLKTLFGDNAATRDYKCVVWVKKHRVNGTMVELVGEKTEVKSDSSQGGGHGDVWGGTTNSAAAEDVAKEVKIFIDIACSLEMLSHTGFVLYCNRHPLLIISSLTSSMRSNGIKHKHGSN